MILKGPYSWKQIVTFTVAVIGFVAAVIGIYSFYFSDKTIDLQVEVVSDINVLDINANLSKLDIIYNGESLKGRRENLRIITIKIKNHGNASVLNGYYDSREPIGVNISGGKIVEKAVVVGSSNSYIQRNLRPVNNGGVETFNALILEPDDYYTVQLLVLHDISVNPKVTSFGKIAGQKNIEVISANPTKNVDRKTLDAHLMQFMAILSCLMTGMIFLALINGRNRKRIYNEFQAANKKSKEMADKLADIVQRLQREGN